MTSTVVPVDSTRFFPWDPDQQRVIIQLPALVPDAPRDGQLELSGPAVCPPRIVRSAQVVIRGGQRDMHLGN